MLIKKNKNKVLFILLLFSFTIVNAQKIEVYKIDQLLKRINNTSDTTYVVNFWATWCKPCVAELPDFEKLHLNYKNSKLKVLLVSLDFKEEIPKKLKSFLQKNNYTCEVVLLDEVNGNDFIDKISSSWTGAIPATLITQKNKSKNQFFEQKINYDFLVEKLK